MLVRFKQFENFISFSNLGFIKLLKYILFIFSSGAVVCLIIYNYSDTYTGVTSCSKLVNVNNQKIILLFTPFYQEFALWEIYFMRIIVGSCTESRCRFVNNKSDLALADAVLFSAADLPLWAQIDKEDLSKRNPKQLWILFTMDPPTKFRGNLDGYSNFFNMTMSYDMTADIVTPFGSFLPKKRLQDQNPFLVQVAERGVDISSKEFLTRERHSVIFLSSCKGSSSNREEYLKKLKKHMSVDVFGECGMKKGIALNLNNSFYSKFDVTKEIVPNYYFYLAFENSICPYYNTEHFYRALHLGVVPVILGPLTPEAKVPPNSYIDASRFQDPKHLAKFLIHVSKYNTLYLKYHEWRQDFTVHLGFPYDPQTCDLCAKLHQKISPTVHKNISQWLSKDRCSS